MYNFLNIYDFNIYHKIMIVPFITLFFLCITYLMGEFRKDDINFFRNTLNLKKLGNSMREELE